MRLINKNEGAANTLHFVANTAEQQQDIKTLIALQEVRDLAFYYANKYRFDPILSRVHSQYLSLLNQILEKREIP